MSKRQNKKLQTRVKNALQNTEEARTIILEKLDALNSQDVVDQKQLSLLVSMKLSLLDVKMTLKSISEELGLIK